MLTEQEWLESKDPVAMLLHLNTGGPGKPHVDADGKPVTLFGYPIVYTQPHPSLTPRKMRLFLCAACRQVDRIKFGDDQWLAVEAGESYADGKISEQKRHASMVAANQVSISLGDHYT